MQPAPPDDPFYVAFRGNFTGLLSWNDLSTFWDTVRKHAAARWYVYAIGEAVPGQPSITFSMKSMHYCAKSITRIIAALFIPTVIHSPR